MGISFNLAFSKKVPPYGKLGRDHMALGAGSERLDKVRTGGHYDGHYHPAGRRGTVPVHSRDFPPN